MKELYDIHSCGLRPMMERYPIFLSVPNFSVKKSSPGTDFRARNSDGDDQRVIWDGNEVRF